MQKRCAMSKAHVGTTSARRAPLTFASAIAAVAFAALTITTAHAAPGTTSWYGTEAGANDGTASAPNLGTTLGQINPTASLILSDQGITPGINTDDWTFSLANPSSLSSSFTGQEVDLTQLTFAGDLNSVNLYSSATNTIVAQGTVVAGVFGGLTYMAPSGGSFYLQVVSTVTPGATGSYTGTMNVVAQAAPEPATVGLMAVGLSAVIMGGNLRRRRK